MEGGIAFRQVCREAIIQTYRWALKRYDLRVLGAVMEEMICRILQPVVNGGLESTQSPSAYEQSQGAMSGGAEAIA